MKKGLAILTVAGVVLFASCTGNEPASSEQEDPTRGQKAADEQETAKSFPVGEWRATHQYFKRTVEGLSEINADRPEETSISPAEKDAYRLTFKDDGTGFGSGLAYDGSKRHEFHFEWELSDGLISLRGVDKYSIFLHDEYYPTTAWKVEEFSADKMVLWTEWYVIVDLDDGGWHEESTYRYTFEKVTEK